MNIPTSLFASVSTGENLVLPDAELLLIGQFLDPISSACMFKDLLEQTPWRQDAIRMHGRLLPVPRLQAWYGEAHAKYGYSGLQLDPLPFTPLLLQLKEHVQETVGHKFNSVLLNQYRNGSDSVSWHSDDETELGADPLIASVSLGCERRFELKHRSRKELKKLTLPLTDGSLLFMGKGVQQHWLHQIPKQPGVVEVRINLTFRLID